jgi:lipopolysaccharide transport system permease protein
MPWKDGSEKIRVRIMTETTHESIFDQRHVTVIEPATGWRMLDWRELWAYRELFWVLTTRDIKVRYKQTLLGAAWAVIRPLTAMVIFSLVFGRLANMPSEGYPYPLFVFAGLLPWTFFAAAVSASSQSLIGSGQLVTKVYFPRLIIPLSAMGSGVVDLLISTLILLLMMLWYGVGWSSNLLAAPLLIAAVVFTALGIGTLLSALTVAYRDFSHLTPFLVQVWMYVTPIIFPVSIVPERWQWLLYLNPLTGVVEGFRAAFLDRPFNLTGLLVSILIGVVMLVAGVAYFEKVERRFADII